MAYRRNRRRKAPTENRAPQATVEHIEQARPQIVVREASSMEDVAAIHAFMLHNAVPEMAEATVDAQIYMRTLWNTAQNGCSLIAIDADRERIVGYLGIVKTQYSYGPESFLHDDGFFVLPAYRGGPAEIALLGEAKLIAIRAQLPLKIIDTNPVKHRHPRGRLARTAEIIGYRPHGRIFTAFPQTTN